MRENQEVLVREPDHRDLGQLLGLDHSIDARDASAFDARRHVGSNRLWAENGDPDSAIAVGDRNPLGERDGRVFGDRIGRRADLRKKTGGRTGIQQIALASFEHRGKNRMSCVHMGHDIDVPDTIP